MVLTLYTIAKYQNGGLPCKGGGAGGLGPVVIIVRLDVVDIILIHVALCRIIEK